MFTFSVSQLIVTVLPSTVTARFNVESHLSALDLDRNDLTAIETYGNKAFNSEILTIFHCHHIIILRVSERIIICNSISAVAQKSCLR